MAGAKVNNYAIGDSDIEAVMLTTDQIYKGQCHVTLTEMTTTTVPKIAAGSWIENNGTLFKFDSDETLTGSPSDGIVYIRIVPSTTTCTAEMTNTAPTWSDSKQGWYGTSTYANYRYVGGCTKSSSSYTYKFILLEKNGLGLKYYRNSFSIGTLEDLSFKTLTIEDLQMYAIGDIEIASWSIVDNSYSPKITIKKPCSVYFNIKSTISPYKFRLEPGYYYFRQYSTNILTFYQSLDGTTTNLIPIYFESGSTTTPWQVSGVLAPGTASLHCIYSEGLNTLDADLIAE